VDRADVAFGAAMRVAVRGGDLEDALRELLHLCGRRRDVLEIARARCQAMIEADPLDLTARRTLELLDGALRTPLYAPATP
jgi:hypothetical protein